MTKTITAMFDRYADAKSAVNRLESAGIYHDQISIVSNDAEHKRYTDETGTGTGTGASLGTLIGGGAGLLAGLGLLAIPGLGPVVAAGWLASTALGAGVGAAAGGLVGMLTDAGIDETDANAYAEGVRRGGTLVTVRADDAMAEQAADILDDDGTIDMDERQSSWRNEGWSGTYRSDDSLTGGTSTGVAGGMTGGMGTTGAMGGSTGSTMTRPSAGTMAEPGAMGAGTMGDDSIASGDRGGRVRIHNAGERSPL
jgi:uncharacterized membrane protein